MTEGDNIVYSLVATNLGPTTATGVQVTDPVPAGTTFASASAGCALALGTVTCTAGTLAPGASQAFSITVLALPGNSVTNTATVAGLQPDPNLANNTASVTTSINLNPVCTAAATGLGDGLPGRRQRKRHAGKSTAARSTGTGAGTPVHSSNAAAPWATSTSSPPTTRAPPARAASAVAVSG